MRKQPSKATLCRPRLGGPCWCANTLTSFSCAASRFANCKRYRVQGQVVCEALARQSKISRDVQSFSEKTMEACSDDASACDSALRRLKALRGNGWGCSHSICKQHKRALMHTNSLGKLPELKEDISGILRSVLGIRKHKDFILWQRCLHVAIRELTTPVRGAPPNRVTRHRILALRTFVSGTGDKETIIRYLLKVLPKWRLAEQRGAGDLRRPFGLGRSVARRI